MNDFSSGGTHRAEFGALEFRDKKSERFGTEQTYRLTRGLWGRDMVVVLFIQQNFQTC
jgi:hypothetical protein